MNPEWNCALFQSEGPWMQKMLGICRKKKSWSGKLWGSLVLRAKVTRFKYKFRPRYRRDLAWAAQQLILEL